MKPRRPPDGGNTQPSGEKDFSIPSGPSAPCEEPARGSCPNQGFGDLVENLGVGVFRVAADEEGTCVRANPALVRMLGYDCLEEFLKVPAIRHGADPASWGNFLQLLEKKPSLNGYESLLRRKDGTEVWCRVSARARFDQAGRMCCLDGTVEDIGRQKRAQQTEARYRHLTENLTDLVWTMDMTLRFTYVSPSVEKMLGYSAEEALNLTARAILAAESYERALKTFAEELALERDGLGDAGRTRTLDLEHLRKDGSALWCETKMLFVRDGTGRAVAIEGVTRDVTERRAAARALYESEEKYRTLVESAGEAITTMDRDGRMLFVNTIGAKRMGGRPEDFVGKTVFDLFPPEVAEQKLAAIRAAIDTGQGSVTVSQTVIQGETRWYRTSVEPLRDAAGNVKAALVIARDIHEQRQAEEALRTSEARYRGLVESQQDLICRFDPQGRLTLVNDVYCRTFGRDRDELIGTSFLPLIHPDDRAIAARGMAELLRPPYRVRMEQRAMTAQGWRWLEWENYAIHDEAGRIKEIQAVGRDITQRKEAEEALQRANRKLMTAREEERRALAAELHDSVGQYLVALKLSVQNAVPTEDDPVSQRVAGVLRIVAAQCSELIREVRHICQGLYPPALERLGLVAAIQNLAGYCHAGNVQADIRCSEEVRHARFGHAVEIALFRIAQEAVHNALRHGQARRINLDLVREDDSLKLIVDDNGVGFDPDDRAVHGMGLNTMKQRAEAVGGKLLIQSRPGATRVEARVPIPKAPEGDKPLADGTAHE